MYRKLSLLVMVAATVGVKATDPIKDAAKAVVNTGATAAQTQADVLTQNARDLAQRTDQVTHEVANKFAQEGQSVLQNQNLPQPPVSNTTVVVEKPKTDGLFVRAGNAVRGAGNAVVTFIVNTGKTTKKVAVAAVTPQTYVDGWNYLTWEHIKAAPVDAWNYMADHKLKTALAAALIVGAIVEYKTGVVRDALFGPAEEDEENKEGKETEIYFLNQAEVERYAREVASNQ